MLDPNGVISHRQQVDDVVAAVPGEHRSSHACLEVGCSDRCTQHRGVRSIIHSAEECSGRYLSGDRAGEGTSRSQYY